MAVRLECSRDVKMVGQLEMQKAWRLGWKTGFGKAATTDNLLAGKSAVNLDTK